MATKRYSILVENADGTVGNMMTFTADSDEIANEQWAIKQREYPDKQLHLVSYPS
jgi:hypothetical protein